MTVEVFNTSPTGGWRAQSTTQNMEPNLMLQAFNENSTEKSRQSGPVPETQSVTDKGESVVTDDTRSSAGQVDATATVVSSETASPSVAPATPQSEPPQESILRQSEDESVVTDDTHSSAGQVDAPVPADTTEAASPSVASVAPQSLQQATRADQNKAEQTAPAEQPEVTDTESKKTEELPMDKALEEQRKELQREIEELRREMKEINKELTKARMLSLSRTRLQNELSEKEKSIGKLEKKLQSFTEANSEKKQEKATSLKNRVEQSYLSYKKEWDVISARDLGDFLSQMLIENKIAPKQPYKAIGINRNDPFTWCLAYKFGRELRGFLSSRHETRAYSNNTEITVRNDSEYNDKFTNIYIKNQTGDSYFYMWDNDIRLSRLEIITTDLNDSQKKEAIEYQAELEKYFHKFESEFNAFTEVENPEEACREYYNRAISFEREQIQRVNQQLETLESEDQLSAAIKTQIDALKEKRATLKKNKEMLKKLSETEALLNK
ncbi:hypothetical protein F9222_26175 [Escherichia coli]|nr:hypothetical protein F9222_26175 [Escherichia coli]